MKIKVLDNGYVRLVESYGRGDAGIMEAGIIEAARQSTQGNFRGWDIWHCGTCGNNFKSKINHDISGGLDELSSSSLVICKQKNWSNDEKLLGFLFNNEPKHSTPFEFCGLIIEVQAPIFVFREWHRHRTQSYNEMSARYAPLPDMNYVPDKERLFLTQNENKQAQAISGSKQLDDNYAEGWLSELAILYERAEKVYQYGLDVGIPKEVARVVLPVGRYSKMRASANLLNWLKFLSLRMDSKAQWEIRQYANAVAEIISNEFPKTWSQFKK
ncbi:MAG: FAD-dependent thymidylate synthase [Bacteroidetes bacterium]|nr:FAD-dependent thymidylate synthase [Bacteroidota bacterium]